MQEVMTCAARLVSAAVISLGALTACSDEPIDGTGTATGTFVGPAEADGSDERHAVRIEANGGVREFELRSGETYKAEGLPPMIYSVTSDAQGGVCPKSIEIRENTTVNIDLTWPCSG